jgi:chromate transport protein ChrA
MLFSINYIRGGVFAGLCALMLWWFVTLSSPSAKYIASTKTIGSLPGAIGMYGLSLGVSRIGDTLPPPVYALLSGLNAATVGIIALAAVQLSQKAIIDKLSRILVFFGGTAGMLYTALWYFPVLMAAAGLVTVVWDYRWPHRIFLPLWRKLRPLPPSSEEDPTIEAGHTAYTSGAVSLRSISGQESHASTHQRHAALSDRSDANSVARESHLPTTEIESSTTELRTSNRVVPPNVEIKTTSWKTGIYVLLGFLVSFVTIMILRGLLNAPPRGFALFANLYLAGTIIFGGGPVVIPLLREYIVAEGWVSPRDFLLGLALIQAFPGPNFNFAVYLGSLATAGTGLPSAVGALIGFLAIFTPGIVIMTGIMGVWKVLRSRRWLLSVLRGINAAAVGLVFAAFYKLWQIGFVDAEFQSGSPLGIAPWWVTITATSFVGGAWFGLSAPFAIVLGGVMGLVWYGIVKA